MISQFANFFECRSKRMVTVIAIALTLFLGVLDLATGIEIHFSLIYLLPIFLGSWFVSGAVGVYLAIVASLVGFGADSLSSRIYSSQWIPYWNLLLHTGLFVVFAFTQAHLRIQLDELANLASRDFLTGLPNGRAFYRLAAEEMNRAVGLEPLTLACLDVSGIQLVNERLGYPIGDQMVCTIAHTIRQNLARPDLVGRLSGTTFAILLPKTASAGANLVLEQLHNALKDEHSIYSHSLLNFYISAVACPKAPRTVAELMQEADNQMTRMKNAKKDFIQIVTSEGHSLLN